MPIGFPASPTIGQQYPVVDPLWEWNGTVWESLSGTPVTLRYTSLVSTDDALFLRGGVPGLVSASVMSAEFGGGVSPTGPAAFTSGQWTLTPIAGGLRYGINALPSNGGSALTALQYTLNGGTTWNPFSGTGTGNRDVLGLPETLQTTEIRAVNAIDNGAASDTKTETPLAAPAGNIVNTLLTGSPIGFAIVPGDTTVTRCYVESTGASATTLCANGAEIGTIECVTTGQYITFPSGVKPVYNDLGGGDVFIRLQAGGKIIYNAGSTYTGSGDMVFAGAWMREAGQTGAPVYLGAGDGVSALWDSNQRAIVEQQGLGTAYGRNGAGGSFPAWGLSEGQDMVFVIDIGDTATNATIWKEGPETAVLSPTYSSRGAWGVSHLSFGSEPAGSDIFVGRMYAGMIIQADPSAPQRDALATYLGAIHGLTLP